MRWIAPVVAIAIFATASDASAHAEEPNARAVFPVEDGWVLRANFGVVSSDQPERLVCEEAYLGGDGWLLGVLGPTEWITFGERSVRRTEDGCAFEKVATIPTRPSDAIADPATGNAAYVINGPTEPGLYVSTDRGVSFTLYDGIDTERYQLTGVRFLGDQGDQIAIVSGYDRNADAASALFRVAIPSGDVDELAAPPDTTFAYILAARASQIVLLARREGQVIFWGPLDELTRDEVELGSWPTGAAISGDGETVWVSGVDGGRGVLVGSRPDGAAATWETIARETTANCIAHDEGDELYVCGLNRSEGSGGFDVQRLLPDGSVEGVVDFRDFVGSRECPDGSDVAGICPLVWNEIAPYFGVDPNETSDAGEPGGGPPDASVVDDISPTPPLDAGERAVKGGGCCTTITPAGSNPWIPLTALLAVLFARFRRVR